MEKVSVIIPSYNRFKFLLKTIESIKAQTFSNIEIIVVNDRSTDEKYYKYNWKEEGVGIIHLEKNSKEIFGHGSPGYVRNQGLKVAKGKYIAFCDDDDMWFPEKITLQINAMKESKCKMSSTEGIIGSGIYDETTKYKRYNSVYFYKKIRKIFKRKNSNLLDNGYPKIWNLDFIKVHNCIITSSVIVEKEILDKIGGMPTIRRGQDYQCWLLALKHTNSVYVNEICFYYDAGHGYGANH